MASIDQPFVDNYVQQLIATGQANDGEFFAWRTPTGEVYYGAEARPERDITPRTGGKLSGEGGSNTTPEITDAAAAAVVQKMQEMQSDSSGEGGIAYADMTPADLAISMNEIAAVTAFTNTGGSIMDLVSSIFDGTFKFADVNLEAAIAPISASVIAHMAGTPLLGTIFNGLMTWAAEDGKDQITDIVAGWADAASAVGENPTTGLMEGHGVNANTETFLGALNGIGSFVFGSAVADKAGTKFDAIDQTNMTAAEKMTAAAQNMSGPARAAFMTANLYKSGVKGIDTANNVITGKPASFPSIAEQLAQYGKVSQKMLFQMAPLSGGSLLGVGIGGPMGQAAATTGVTGMNDKGELTMDSLGRPGAIVGPNGNVIMDPSYQRASYPGLARETGADTDTTSGTPGEAYASSYTYTGGDSPDGGGGYFGDGSVGENDDSSGGWGDDAGGWGWGGDSGTSDGSSDNSTGGGDGEGGDTATGGEAGEGTGGADDNDGDSDGEGADGGGDDGGGDDGGWGWGGDDGGWWHEGGPVMHEGGQVTASANNGTLPAISNGLNDLGKVDPSREDTMTYHNGGPAKPAGNPYVQQQQGLNQQVKGMMGPKKQAAPGKPNLKPGDVPATLQQGEFVIPRDVVKIKGTEFFEKAIMGARKTHVEAKGRRGKQTAQRKMKGVSRFDPNAPKSKANPVGMPKLPGAPAPAKTPPSSPGQGMKPVQAGLMPRPIAQSGPTNKPILS